MPVEIPQRKGDPLIFDIDECPAATDFETLSAMRPAFKKDGFGTAGNASIISDGAAAVVVMSREKAEALGCTIMATIGAQASCGIDMKYDLPVAADFADGLDILDDTDFVVDVHKIDRVGVRRDIITGISDAPAFHRQGGASYQGSHAGEHDVSHFPRFAVCQGWDGLARVCIQPKANR